MNLGPSRKCPGRPATIKVADDAKNQKRQDGLLVMIKIWVSSYVTMRCLDFRSKHEECFVHIGLDFMKIGLHSNHNQNSELKNNYKIMLSTG